MPNTQIRIDREALDRWKAAIGLPLDDGAAANAAIRLAAELPERELHAMRYGMRWLLDLMQRGHLQGLDMSIEIEGSEIAIRAVEGGIAHLSPTCRIEVGTDA